MSNPAIAVAGLGKCYRLGGGGGTAYRYKSLRDSVAGWFRRAAGEERRRADTLWALSGVSFAVDHGEVVGIIGPNGAGKSTLLKILARITEPTEGYADVEGRVGSLLEVGTGFHPELTGRENILLNGAILGMRRAEILQQFDAIVAFAEVEAFLDTPVKHYSSGMAVRLAFAVAAHLQPEILLVDEVLAVGDIAFQKKCLGKMSDVARSGRTVLLVSHNLAAIQNLCRRAILLEAGRTTCIGPVDEVVARYLVAARTADQATLADRPDRRGDGRLRMQSFTAHGATGQPGALLTGQPAQLIIRYAATTPLRNVEFHIGVFTSLGEGALFLANSLVRGPFEAIPAQGTVTCRFDRLPLLPDQYAVNLFCSVNGVMADWVTQAARFEVASGDFFGTGRLPPRGYGTTAVPHQWDASPA